MRTYKKVLIVSRRMQRKHKPIQWVSEVYTDILGAYRVIPVIVPISESTPALLPYYLHDYDGLLIVEGGDIHPQRYNSVPQYNKLEEIDLLKDEIEFQCIHHALAHKKSIFGICRGMHVLNVALGGTLYTDVHDQNSHTLLHIDYSQYDAYRHRITLAANSFVRNCYGVDDLQVTSYHHQGVATLGANLQATAFAPDGLIEAVEHSQLPFAVGLQFHPERMLDEHEGNSVIFEKFIASLATKSTEYLSDGTF